MKQIPIIALTAEVLLQRRPRTSPGGRHARLRHQTNQRHNPISSREIQSLRGQTSNSSQTPAPAVRVTTRTISRRPMPPSILNCFWTRCLKRPAGYAIQTLQEFHEPADRRGRRISPSR